MNDTFYAYKYTKNYWFITYLWLGILISENPEYSARKSDRLLDLLDLRRPGYAMTESQLESFLNLLEDDYGSDD